MPLKINSGKPSASAAAHVLRWQNKRKIIHVDMDAFFAAIEIRDNPKLKGLPVIIGGDPNSRSVVSTASYEARKFGVRSAMPTVQAKKLCPRGIFLRPNFEKYSAASKKIMAILSQHTELMEPVSIDEAYLDVTKHKFNIQDPVMIAKLIKQNIHAVTQLTASAGVAANLFLAKVSSDFKKPDGLTVVYPGEEEAFLENLSVRKIPGVGPVLEKELNAIDIETCGQLAGLSRAFLIKRFGKTGVFLYERARGRDSRQVEPNMPSKQYSEEETFSRDIKDKAILKAKLKEISDDIFNGLLREGRMGRIVVLKVKYFDFELITRSKTLAVPPKSSGEIWELACNLLDTKTAAGVKPVRLVGLGISGLEEPHGKKESRQGELF